MTFDEFKAKVLSIPLAAFEAGPAEDCRQGNTTVQTYIVLAGRGLVKRRADETYITQAGRKALEEEEG